MCCARSVRCSGSRLAVAGVRFLAVLLRLCLCLCCCLRVLRRPPRLLQIDAFRTVAEPYTVSAFKVGRRISTAASDVFDRMSTAGPKTRTKSVYGKQRMD